MNRKKITHPFNGTNKTPYLKMKFKPGQEIVCISEVWTIKGIPDDPKVNPKMHEVVTVNCYNYCGSMISLVEYDHSFYSEDGFAPVISDEELEETLNEIPELIY